MQLATLRIRIALICLSVFGLGSPLSQSANAQTALDALNGPAVTLPEVPGLKEFQPRSAPQTAQAVLRRVRLEARLTPEGQPVRHGLTWRVFSPIRDSDGILPLLATAEGGSTDIEVESGDYFIHVAFGRAGITRRLTVPSSGAIDLQPFILNAGGVILNAVSGNDQRIPSAKLRFSIYTGPPGADDDRRLVVEDVAPEEVVRLNTGTYHIVSSYGSLNAVIRADIRVEAGKLTEATIQHRAAQLTLKLVAGQGGEAIADTGWSIFTAAGDLITESVGAFPTVVLAEGDYTAVARNKTINYARDFTVVAGRNTEIEVLLSQKIADAN